MKQSDIIFLQADECIRQILEEVRNQAKEQISFQVWELTAQRFDRITIIQRTLIGQLESQLIKDLRNKRFEDYKKRFEDYKKERKT